MPEIVLVVVSLICLMIANIIMGKKIADFKDEYNKEKFIGGISKALFTLVGLVLIYISTLAYPMDVAEVNGQMVSTLTGTTILLKTANLLYAGKVLLKIKDIFSVDVPVNLLNTAENKDEVKTSEPKYKQLSIFDDEIK